MELELIFRIAAIGILLSIVNSILEKSDKKELIPLANLTGIIIVIIMLVPHIREFFDTIKTIFLF